MQATPCKHAGTRQFDPRTFLDARARTRVRAFSTAWWASVSAKLSKPLSSGRLLDAELSQSKFTIELEHYLSKNAQSVILTLNVANLQQKFKY